MAKAFEESHQAYAGGDGARAKELSNAGKKHQAEMERLNREASEWIYVGECSGCVLDFVKGEWEVGSREC